MKKTFVLTFLLLSSELLFAQNEIGPEGGKLMWVVLAIVALVLSFFLFRKKSDKKVKAKSLLFQIGKVSLELEKDSLYYPDNLTLKVKNTGNSDIDLGQPLLVFDNFWLKRKFKLKGMENHTFYPLYLEKGKTHTLQIDLKRFYSHDKKLKKFPKVKIYVFNVKGRRLKSKSVYLRKTLVKF